MTQLQFKNNRCDIFGFWRDVRYLDYKANKPLTLEKPLIYEHEAFVLSFHSFRCTKAKKMSSYSFLQEQFYKNKNLDFERNLRTS